MRTISDKLCRALNLNGCFPKSTQQIEHLCAWLRSQASSLALKGRKIMARSTNLTVPPIFISYAHNDNDSPDPAKRWLNRLREQTGRRTPKRKLKFEL